MAATPTTPTTPATAVGSFFPNACERGHPGYIRCIRVRCFFIGADVPPSIAFRRAALSSRHMRSAREGESALAGGDRCGGIEVSLRRGGVVVGETVTHQVMKRRLVKTLR